MWIVTSTQRPFRSCTRNIKSRDPYLGLGAPFLGLRAPYLGLRAPCENSRNISVYSVRFWKTLTARLKCEEKYRVFVINAFSDPWTRPPPGSDMTGPKYVNCYLTPKWWHSPIHPPFYRNSCPVCVNVLCTPDFL